MTFELVEELEKDGFALDDQGGLKQGIPEGISAADLMQMDFPEPKWAVPGILPEGLNILGGKPKQGKSILSLNIGIAIASGGKALGQIDVKQGKVIYFALEDPYRRLKERMVQMLQGRPAPRDLYLFNQCKRIGNGGAEYINEQIEKHPGLRLVIIDTLAKIKPSSTNNNKTWYDKDYENIESVKELADSHSISILLVHHLRKSESTDVMDTFSGTFGLTGAADGLLALIRKSGQVDAELHITGRDMDSAQYALRYEPSLMMWNLLGDVQDVKSSRERQALYDALKDAGEPLSPSELAKEASLKHHYVRKTLPLFIEDGTVIKVERGKYIYAGNKGNNGNNQDNLFPKHAIVPESKKSGNNLKRNNNKVLSVNVPNVPNVPDVPNNGQLSNGNVPKDVPGNKCSQCKAYDESSNLCHGESYFKGKASKGVPQQMAMKNCPSANEI